MGSVAVTVEERGRLLAVGAALTRGGSFEHTTTKEGNIFKNPIKCSY